MKKKLKNDNKSFVNVIIKIIVSFNNTIITVTDMSGNVICWSTSGVMGFKGSKKSTPYAAQIAAENVCTKLKPYNIKNAHIEIRGPGSGRESVIRAFANKDFDILDISDKTPIPHNGCRLPKRRRV
jgi:small subunit ribosomal protein S11